MVTFSADVWGNPGPFYQWRKDGTNLVNSASVSGVTTPWLRLFSVQSAQAGDYSLVASNTLGAATSLVARLTVAPAGPLDRWTWSHPTPQGNNLRAVTCGAGRFVAVGNEGAIVTSTNGLSWTECAVQSFTFRDVTSGNGQFVAVGDLGTIFSSSDGFHWTQREVPARSHPPYLSSVGYGNGLFVAAGGAVVLVSTDGRIWTEQPTDFYPLKLAFGNGRFVSVGSLGSAWGLFTSNDGSTWTQVPNLNLDGVVFTGGQFFGWNRWALYTSPDGLGWTPRKSLQAGERATLFGAASGNGLSVAVGYSILASGDGMTWHYAVPDTTNDLSSVAFGAGRFVAVGENGTLLTSTNGTGWTAVCWATDSNFRGVAWNGERYVAVGNEGAVWVSASGRYWTRLESITPRNLRAVVFGTNRFVAVGEDGALFSSADGLSWSPHSVTGKGLYGITYGGGRFITVGNDGTILASLDGTIWGAGTSGTVNRLQGITWGDARYVATGRNGTILTSTDGLAWTAQNSGTNSYLEAVAYGDGLYVAAGQSGTVVVSSNAVDWTVQKVGGYAEWEAVVFGGGQFLVAGQNGAVFSSSDATNWIARCSPSDLNVRAGLFAAGSFLLVGNNETVLQSAPLQPWLEAGDLTETGFELWLCGPGQRDYFLQASGDLQTWTNLFTFRNVEDPLLFVDPDALDLPQRYYRVVPATLINPLPASRTVYSGSATVLEAPADGLKPCSYQWRYNGVDLLGATNSTLELSDVQLAHTGHYSVVVSNSLGVVTSTAAHLTILEGAPVFLSQPASQTVFPGQAVTFRVTADGSQPLHYQWRLNGVDISEATGPVLALDSVDFGQAGQYSVLLSNSFGRVTSSEATLTVSPVIAWGYNGYGQCNVPAELAPPLGGVVEITAGQHHCLARKADGTVVAWGSNGYGQANVPAALTGVVAIAAGASHSLALKGDGTVVAWGRNYEGQTNVPPGLVSVVAIAAGAWHSLALKNDRTVVAWGYNGYGQKTNVPTALTGVVAIAAGAYHSLALKGDGTVVAWGENYEGQTNVPPGLAGVVAIAAGSVHGMALKADGTVVAWGNNDYGQTDVPPDLSDAVAIAAGGVHSLVLKTDGTVVGWGANWSGQTAIPHWLTHAVAIAAGYDHSLALVGNGPPFVKSQPSSQTIFTGAATTLGVKAFGAPPLTYQWQFNGTDIVGATNATLLLTDVQLDQAGDYSVMISNALGVVISAPAHLTAVEAPPALLGQPASQVVCAGEAAAFHVTADGSRPLKYQWLFEGTEIAGATEPALVLPAVSTNQAGSYGLRVSNAFGTLTSAVAVLTVRTDSPVLLQQPTNQQVLLGGCVTFRVATGGCPPFHYQWRWNGTNLPGATNAVLVLNGVTSDRAGHYSVVVSNPFGSVTNGTATLDVVSLLAWPNYAGTLLPPWLGDVVAIAVDRNVVLHRDGTVTYWGDWGGCVLAGLTNAVAIAGSPEAYWVLRSDGTVVNGANCNPQIVPGLSNVVAIDAGEDDDLLALTHDGMVVHRYGQSDIPVPADLSNVVAIAAGGSHRLALRHDGTVVAWGSNTIWVEDDWQYEFVGQATVPEDLTDVVAIAAGKTHSLALRSDGTVVAWGKYYQWVEGPDWWEFAANATVPEDLTNVIAIAAGGNRNLALLADGTVRCWGTVLSEDGDENELAVPPGLQNVAAIAAGAEGGNFALAGDGPPFVTAQPVSRSADTGTRTIFHVVATGALPLSYHWQHNGTDIPGATKATLILEQVTHPQAGAYRLVVRNALGVAASSAAVLTVIDSPPFLVLEPSNQMAVAGAEVAFEVAADGARPFHYQWRQNDVDIPGATNAALILSSVTPARAGDYAVVVSNVSGAVTSRVATLVVQPFAFTSQPQNQTIWLGGPARLTVGVSLQGPFNYQWRFNGTNLPGATNATLTLSNVQYEQRGEYSVAVSNRFGSFVSSNASLRVVGMATWGYNGYGQLNVPFDLTNVIATAAGTYHSLALRADGTVAAWGCYEYANWGQTNVPVGLTNVVAIAAGYAHSLALLANGRVVAWGASWDGQIDVPPDLTNAVAIAAGGSHSLGLKEDGTVVAWGDSPYGQTNVPLDLTNAVAIAAGERYSLALKGDGTVVAWGYFLDRDWGDVEPMTVPVGLENVVAIAAGGNHSLALTSDGTVVAWGANWCGETNVPVGLSNVVAIAAGYDHSLALKGDGTVVAWGRKHEDQDSVLAGLANVEAIAAGGWQSFALVVRPGVPVTIGQEASRTAYSGTTVSLSVWAWGASPLSYQWLVNGTRLAHATNSVLVLASVQTSDAGSYAVVVSNSFGAVTSTIAQLTVSTSRPWIVSGPADEDLVVGETAVFGVSVAGSQPFRYQWVFDGASLAGATNAELVLDDVRLDQAGGYSVVVENSFGSVTSQVAALTVQAFRITGQPQSHTAWPGGTATFTVGVSGQGPFTYQWHFNGMDLPAATQPTLTLNSVQFDLRGVYSVTVNNPFGTFASSEARLDVVNVVVWDNNGYDQADVPSDLTNVVAVAASGGHSLALGADGRVMAWGANDAGQTNVPPGLTDVVAIAAGSSQSLALRNDGTVVGWGGLWCGGSSYVPMTVPVGLTNVVAIAAGGYHNLALRADGTVVAWGYYYYSVGGDNYITAVAPAGLANVVAIATGRHHSLALRADGTVVAWGYNLYGETNVPPGIGQVVAIEAGCLHSLALTAGGWVVGWGAGTTNTGNYPDYGQAETPAGLSNVVAIAAGDYRNLALRADGTVVAWGYNSYGQCDAPRGLTNIVAIAAGYGHSLALVGVGPPYVGSQPVNRSVYAGRSTVFHMTATGALPLRYQWQLNGIDLPGATNSALVLTNLQLSDAGNYAVVVRNNEGMMTSRNAHLSVVTGPPFLVKAPGPQYIYQAASCSATFQVEADGPGPLRYQWRHAGMDLPGATNATLLLTNITASDAGVYEVVVSNPFGALTNATATLTFVPLVSWDVWANAPTVQPITATAGLSNVVAVALDGSGGMALSAAGTVVAWDPHNWFGTNNLPAGLTPPSGGVVAIAAGQIHRLALKNNGTVIAWGDNAYGQCDVPTSLRQPSSGAVAIAAGDYFSVALKSDGTILAWGDNSRGQCNVPNGLTPSVGGVVAIAAGPDYAAALKGDGTVVAWGNNCYGQCGVPAGLSQPLAGVVAIAAEPTYVMALKADGTVVVWGDNSSGQCDVPADLAPPVGGVVAMAGGRDYCLALKADGTVVAWGWAWNYMVGELDGLTDAVAIDVADGYSLAVRSDGTVVVWASGHGWWPQRLPKAPTGLRNVVNAVAFTRSYGSEVLALTGDGSPFVTVQPLSQTAIAGNAVTLRVRSTGTAPLSYQWRFNGTNIIGATNASLTIPNTQVAQAGSYKVVVSNALGTVTSRVARLTVLAPPTLEPLPERVSGVVSSNITFTVEATGTPPLRYQWRMNGVNIPSATNSWLTITNVQVSDGASYSVVVANIVGAVTSDPMLLLVEVPQVPPGDDFANRVSLTSLTNRVGGTNRWATREPGELYHAGKFGSNSIWYTWTAPASGIATLRTVGSTFDTLLGIYTNDLSLHPEPSLLNLVAVAEDEDRGGYLTSELRFNAVQGVEYQIAIDGLAGQQGTFILSWELEPTTDSIPVITNQPASQAVPPGGQASFTVTATGSDLTYQWYLNGAVLAGATSSNYTRGPVEETDLGLYTVRVRNGFGREAESLPASLEIAPAPRRVAVDKLEDLFEDGGPGGSELKGPSQNFAGLTSGSSGFISVAMGTVDYQLGNNVGAQSQAWEPNHGGVLGGASQWYELHSESAGTLVIDTIGSSFDTVLAVYRRTNLVNLVANEVASDNDSAPDGLRSRVRFETAAGAAYWVVVDGVGAAQGIIHLNWALGRAPAVSVTATNVLVKRGETLTLSVGVSGAVPEASCQWYRNEVALGGATDPILLVTNLQAGEGGLYSVVVSNAIAVVQRMVAWVEVEPEMVRVVGSGFEDGDEGWSFWGSVGRVVPQLAGGYLFVGNVPAGPLRWVAPGKYLGNRGAAYGGYLQFEWRQWRGGVGTVTNRPTVLLSGHGLTLRYPCPSQSGTNWNTYRVLLGAEAGWERENGWPALTEELRLVLCDLVSMEIVGQLSGPTEACALDNVELLAPCTDDPPLLQIHAVPGQAAIELLWPEEAACFELEMTDSLAQPRWSTSGLTVLGTRNVKGLYSVTVALDARSRYFRLRKGPTAAPCTSESPRLEVRVLGQSTIELAWPEEASCFQLETTATLSAPNWSSDLTVLSSTVADGLTRVTVSVGGSSRFFRLKRP